MDITPNLIKATAETYTKTQLQAKIAACLDKLAEIDYLKTASTGAGASYSIAQRARHEEMIELYRRAIDYLDNGGEFRSGAQVFSIGFNL